MTRYFVCANNGDDNNDDLLFHIIHILINKRSQLEDRFNDIIKYSNKQRNIRLRHNNADAKYYKYTGTKTRINK